MLLNKLVSDANVAASIFISCLKRHKLLVAKCRLCGVVTSLVTKQLLIMYDILLQHLFLCYSSCVQLIMGFFMAGMNIFLLVS